MGGLLKQMLHKYDIKVGTAEAVRCKKNSVKRVTTFYVKDYHRNNHQLLSINKKIPPLKFSISSV
jgi:hypothetical protein